MKLRYAPLLPVVLLSACENLQPDQHVSDGHLKAESHAREQDIPAAVTSGPALPIPEPARTEPTHTVVVHDVPVKELLFSLSRDAELNLDIDEDVSGKVTLNAVEQPLPAILERIAEMAGLTYEVKNQVLRVKKDLPIPRHYRIDYLNMSRTSKGLVSVSTEIGSTGSEGESSSGGNSSGTSLENTSEFDLWTALETNIAAILQENSGDSSPGKSDNIVVNRETGVVLVRATHQQHREIQAFINEISQSSQRQVLIEATIAEVRLKNRYQAGIDWSVINNNGGSGVGAGQTVTDISLNDTPTFALSYTDADLAGNLLQTTLSALETFGDVSIMSSPKVMALNNQTAMLKVVDNLVYFTIDVTIEDGVTDNNGNSTLFATYETEINTVPVGFVMSVTPYISKDQTVTLNLRPTISRVIDYARDPSPALAQVNVVSEIPVIQVREVESVLRVNSGDIAVMGGLMQDEINNNQQGIPLLGRLPLLGPLFRYEDDLSEKTELVVFIKPIVINHASLDGDLKDYRDYLPDTLRNLRP